MDKVIKTDSRPLHQVIFRSLLLFIVILALFSASIAVVINIATDSRRRDNNLQNVAEAIAHSSFLQENLSGDQLTLQIDSLKSVLSDVDVISIVRGDRQRLYHSTHELIGVPYDGTMPDFEQHPGGFYTENSFGPSGPQRRAYAAVYDRDGGYQGFVLAIALMKNIRSETFRTLLFYAAAMGGVALLAMIVSVNISGKIKSRLLGYEPDAFSAMYTIRNNILSALDEGIIAVDKNCGVEFINNAGKAMLGWEERFPEGRVVNDRACVETMQQTIVSGKKAVHVHCSFQSGRDILMDCIPIYESNRIAGAVAIMHDRTEYGRLMEDLAGTRYLVDSIRANNHDFTNKLHVILGLIQMEMYDQAQAYIEKITFVQRETISAIMRMVDDPSVAALLVGKSARAAELNVKFTLCEDSRFAAADLRLPSGTLVTILGNLIDNAFEAMDQAGDDFDRQNELKLQITSRPGALLLIVEDNGPGVAEENKARIFENGFSTKGTGRGTGLYQVKMMVENMGGSIRLDSTEGRGSAFTVRL